MHDLPESPGQLRYRLGVASLVSGVLVFLVVGMMAVRWLPARSIRRLRPPLRASGNAAVLCVVLLCAPAAATAQSLQVGAGAGYEHGVRAAVWLRLDGFKPTHATGTTVTFEVGGLSPRAGLGLSANQAFGPLGNVVFESWLALAEHPAGGAAAEGHIGARGVLGPVALRLYLLGFGATPGAFRPSALASDERPHLATPAFGVQTAITWRISRDLILEAQPEVYLTPTGVALRLDGALRVLRTFGSNELLLLVHGYGAPGLDLGAVAAGAAVTFTRGRDPSITVGATIGYSAAGLWPGVSVSLGQRVGSVRLDLTAALEPYRLDVPALRVTASGRTPLTGLGPQGTELKVEGALASGLGLGSSGSGSNGWLGVSVSVPVSLR